MSVKTVGLECSECGTKYAVTSDSSESIAFCPFCGDGVLMPYDASNDEDFDVDDDLDVDEPLDD